jgi:glycosyltransferase involved in cell wall biosynthesis
VYEAVRAELGGGEPVSLGEVQSKLIKNLARVAKDLTDSDIKCLAQCIDQNLPSSRRQQLLVDISDIVRQDGGTGIQRVVRSILKELLINPPAGFIVEPIYATQDNGYRYARTFTKNFLDLPSDLVSDEPISYRAGDFFLGLDLEYHVQLANSEFLRTLYRAGVKLHFVLYDLIPIQFPHFFEAHHAADELLHRWLSMVTRLGVVICISKSVATELCDWMSKNFIKQTPPFKSEWFHLGSDIASSLPTRGIPPEAKDVLDKLAKRTTFLMVGTFEPRKGHAQVLEAFDGLWKKSSNINLVIVGKLGWMLEGLSQHIKQHSELGLRLFWLEGISDEYLEKIYEVSDCLIAASYVEGFGLPIVEAAKHGIPIIARDISVFREVAGEYAHYFDSEKPEDLMSSINNWLDCYSNGKHIKSNAIKPINWNESSSQLLQIILNKGKN